MTLVVDSSAVLALLLDEPKARSVERILRSEPGTLRAPSLIVYEVANGLRSAIARQRIPIETALDRAGWFQANDIELDHPRDLSVHAGLEDSLRFGLTPYDAAYLRLAILSRAPLLTLDRALRSSAIDAGVSVIDP